MTGHLQQKDNLCGPFHGARVLRAAGVSDWDGEPLDQDLVASFARTVLPEHEVGPQVPPGAVNLRNYRFELARGNHEESGTSALGLAAAIAELSGGRLVCVPVSGAWTPAAVEGLLDGAGGRIRSPVRLIANVRTGLFWGSRPPLEALLAVLDGVDVFDAPAADWDVGHFVELVHLVRGRRGALVVVQDSYPSLGWSGVHLQPPAAVSAALLRGDGRGGGVLAVVAPEEAEVVAQLAGELGLGIDIWDN